MKRCQLAGIVIFCKRKCLEIGNRLRLCCFPPGRTDVRTRRSFIAVPLIERIAEASGDRRKKIEELGDFREPQGEPETLTRTPAAAVGGPGPHPKAPPTEPVRTPRLLEDFPSTVALARGKQRLPILIRLLVLNKLVARIQLRSRCSLGFLIQSRALLIFPFRLLRMPMLYCTNRRNAFNQAI